MRGAENECLSERKNLVVQVLFRGPGNHRVLQIEIHDRGQGGGETAAPGAGSGVHNLGNAREQRIRPLKEIIDEHLVVG